MGKVEGGGGWGCIFIGKERVKATKDGREGEGRGRIGMRGKNVEGLKR